MYPKALFNLEQYGSLPALIEGESARTLSYSELEELSQNFEKFISKEKSLSFFFISSTIDCLIAYLSFINHGHAVALFDSTLNQGLKQQLISLYQPHYVIESNPINSTQPVGYELLNSFLQQITIWQNSQTFKCPKVHPESQLLLSTSGTTGSPKLIRLSRENVLSNATAIAEYLKIDRNERAIASLPFHYSYGLSVLHTHLLSGGSIVMSSNSLVQEGFWQTFDRYACTSLAGVPYTYQLLDRLGLENLHCPTLRTLTQAGGKLSKDLILKFHHLMQKRQGRFFVMYGQTEATARISYLPPEDLPEKVGSIGIAIPGGQLQIFKDQQQVLEPLIEGELIYKGPNVMMGYSKDIKDLALGDELHGILATGDMCYCDNEGFYYITGRQKRISKVYGQRISLDEIEHACQTFGSVAATSDDVSIQLYYETELGLDIESCIAFLSSTFHLASSTFECIALSRLPLTASGKIDYTKLKEV